jgi:hypothetical protein
MPPGTRNALVPPSPNYLRDAGEFTSGLLRGSSTGLMGGLQMRDQLALDAYRSAQAGSLQGLYADARRVAQEAVANPSMITDVVGNSLRGMWNRAKSGPAGLGEVLGENIDPRNFLKPRKAVMAEMADEIPIMPYERAKRLFDDIKNTYVKGEMSFDEYSDRTKPLQKIIFDAEWKNRVAETKGKPIPVFEDLMHIPEETRLTVKKRGFPYEGTESAKVVGTHVLQVKGYGLQRLPIVEYADGRTRRLIDSDIVQVHMPRAVKSPVKE